ncbi:DNA-binding transcriptional LysR family regulator [Paraburkholderia sp. CI2]|nr:DNA-binding transcriptional LysR family regulator [Paraburkholderia sp. CI2]
MRKALDALQRAVAPTIPFDPAAATQTWRIAATDYAESTIILPMLAGLRAVAPGTRLAIVEAVPPRLARQAEQGDIDIGFHTSEGAPEGLRRRVLFAERYVLVGRAGHPKLKRRPTLAQFCKLEHVIVSPDGGGFFGVTDETLAKVGLARKVVLSVPHFLFMQSVLASTDLVGMLPARLVRVSCAARTRCGWSSRPSRCRATRWRCYGTSGCIAIPRINGCGSSSRHRCNQPFSAPIAFS